MITGAKVWTVPEHSAHLESMKMLAGRSRDRDTFFVFLSLFRRDSCEHYWGETVIMALILLLELSSVPNRPLPVATKYGERANRLERLQLPSGWRECESGVRAALQKGLQVVEGFGGLRVVYSEGQIVNS